MRHFIGRSVVIVATVFSLGISTAVSAAPLSGTQVRAQLLSLRQMPKGWYTAPPRSDPRLGCLASLLEPKGVKETQRVQVYFRGPSELPIFDETISTYSNVAMAFKMITADIARCKNVSGLLDGYPVVGTVVPLGLRRYGNASVSYAITLIGKHVTVRSDYVIVRKGTEVLGLLEGSYPSVNVTQLRGFVALAVSKAR